MTLETEETTLARFKLQLEKQLTDLQALNEAGAEAARPVILDQSRVGRLSRMDAMQGQQMAAETVRRRKEEIQRVRAALSRIERDEYGYCLRCDEDIDEKRLESNPSAPLCIKCARG